ncbi:MAG: CorA family divalent cation transporter [Proteocatella sp.]
MLKIISLSDLANLEDLVDEATLERIVFGGVERLECLEGFDLISFDWYNIFDKELKSSQLIIYFTKKNLFFICENEECLDMVQRKVKDFSITEKILSAFFIELLKSDMEYLETLEDDIFEFEDVLLMKSKIQCAQDLISFRRILSKLKRYYEQLNSIIEELIENENDLISNDHIKYFKVVDNRVDRLFLVVLHMQDYVSQVREAYQAQVDIEQNRLMKVFTVITSIFLPLTLIVGWYGMNLKMPEYKWDYGYLFVIIISLVVFVISIMIFKKKEWF